MGSEMFIRERYYFIIKGERDGGNPAYTEKELCFGRDALNNPVLKEYAAAEIKKRESYLNDCPNGESREKILREIYLLTEALK